MGGDLWLHGALTARTMCRGEDGGWSVCVCVCGRGGGGQFLRTALHTISTSAKQFL